MNELPIVLTSALHHNTPTHTSAVYFARNHGARLQQIDAVALATPQVGDAEFNCYADRHVNMRRIAYIGSAQREDVREERFWTYGAGDVVPALPMGCSNMHMPRECALLMGGVGCA